MKITLEPMNTGETEIIIRGDIASEEVSTLLSFINTSNNSGKLILYREDEQFLVNARDIIYLEACDGKVTAVTTEGVYSTKQKLYELKESLSAQPFAQINKGMLVNIDFVKSVSAEFSGNYTLRLKQSKETLTISRKYFKEFKSKI
ncbi:MAG: LytTR family transcriptional regulator DNA-binding domain-containing protein [Ruminococcus sp.]|nr:LytTR family transcriptional regulator DNA-binding domain-containing protein [Ruminococcus sp.]